GGAKVLKLVAVPAVLGIASLRVYALDEEGADGQLSPRQLPIYSPSPGHGRFVEEHPGALQGGFAALRGRVESRVQTAKGSLRTMKSGAVNLYHAGEDIYYYLKDPPPDLLPRVSLIAVLGFSGLFLARNGSPFKRLLFPVGMASVGIAVCYPAQTLAMLKGGGKKAYNVSQWSASAVAALWKMKPDIESAASASASPVRSLTETTTVCLPCCET
uniref:MICOS complex subunit n=1 Tax=Denticeps clupeoides TaxID=299321 RepID=A0AAY4CS79_9TELE